MCDICDMGATVLRRRTGEGRFMPDCSTCAGVAMAVQALDDLERMTAMLTEVAYGTASDCAPCGA